MKITSKTLPKSQVLLTVELEEKEWTTYYTQAVRSIAEQVKIPGFRKGHIPEKVLVEQVGVAAIMGEAIDLALPQSYVQAIKKEDLHPIAQPDIKITSEKPFAYEATISVMPTAEVKPLTKLKIKKEEIKVTKKEVEEMLEMFQGQLAEKKEVSRDAKRGDTVEVDFAGYDMDGVQLDGTQSKHHPLEIGSNTMIPGFEDELIGLKENDEKSFEITFPKEYHSKNFANKKVRFDIKVHHVFEKELPKVDEAFVEKLTGTKKSVDELKEEITQALIERKTSEQRRDHEAALLEAVEKVVTIELPEILIEEEVSYLLDNIKMQGLQSGLTWEKQLEHMKKTEDDLKKEMRPQAEKQVRTRFGIQQFLDTDNITAQEKEIMAQIERTKSRMNKKDLEKKMSLFAKGEQGWLEAENKVRVAKWMQQKLEELVK